MALFNLNYLSKGPVSENSHTGKQLLNAGRGHQARRKAAHCLQKEVGKNIKIKRKTKEVGMKICLGKGVLKKREVSKHQETFSLANLW